MILVVLQGSYTQILSVSSQTFDDPAVLHTVNKYASLVLYQVSVVVIYYSVPRMSIA